MVYRTIKSQSHSLHAQCPTGTIPADFTWEGAGSGNQAVWNPDDVSNTYTNLDGTGLDVTVDLSDPFGQNTDTGNPSDFGDYTESNAFYGPGILSFQITAAASGQAVCLSYTFSQPVYIGDFTVSDIDSNGDESDDGPLQSFQDQVTITATGVGGANEPLTLTAVGGAPTFTITGQTASANYADGVINGVAFGDPNGAVTASTSELITTLTICYENGPDDLDGLSNSQAIAIPGSSFCIPEPASICGTVTEDTDYDGTGDTPMGGVTLALCDSSGEAILDDLGIPITVTTAEDGTYCFTDLLPGDYQVKQTDPDGYKSTSDSDGGNSNIIGDGTPITLGPGGISNGNDFVDELVVALNVDLIEFTAKHEGDAVALHWTTASESNNSHFVIEKSANGVRFEKLAHVDGAGNSSTTREYRFLDLKIDQEENSIYYRLKQVDFNGRYEYSDIRIVDFDSSVKTTASSAYPNPVLSDFSILLPNNSESVQIQIFDINGKQLIDKKYNAGEKVMIENLRSGMYTLVITDNNKEQTIQKLIKS